jgi:hypothetical protein
MSCWRRFFAAPLAKETNASGNGNRIQHPLDLNDQWALFCHYGSLRPLESYWLAPGGMVLILFTSNMDGSARSDLFLAELPAR